METQARPPQAKPLLIRSMPKLIRFRLLAATPDVQVIAAAESRPEAGEETADREARGIRWLVLAVKEAGTKVELQANRWVEGQRVLDFDLCVESGKCLWVSERNSLEGALLLSEHSWDGAAAAIAPFQKEPLLVADLPPSRTSEVKVETPWHAPLPPPRWLFSPRVSKDPQGKWLVTCNTVNGHQLELAGPKQAAGPDPTPARPRDKAPNWDESRFLPERLFPVTIRRAGRQITAFIQARPATNLFFALPRYEGPPPDGALAGNLVVEIDQAQVVDMSTTMELGPVLAFDVDLADAERLAIAALHYREKTMQLTVLQSATGGKRWNKMASLVLEGKADKVALRAVSGNRLYVAYSLVENDFSIIRLITLPWPN